MIDAKNDSLTRCPWALGSSKETVYHDEEWGKPLHDDTRLFEFLVLEGAQAGLSWRTILNKRDNYRRVFRGFDAEVVARFGEPEIADLLADPGIVRNRLKVESAVRNARGVLKLREQFGNLDAFLWRFVDGRPIQNAWREQHEVPAETEISKAMSRELKTRGFNFVGPTVCYAFMQAVGMVNDHLESCFRHREVAALK